MTLSEYLNNWIKGGMCMSDVYPLCIYDLDGFSGIVVKKDGCFQIEFRYMYGVKDTPVHSHPSAETIILRFDEETCEFYEQFHIMPGDKYYLSSNKIEPILVAQKFNEGELPTNSVINWSGELDGDKHVKLLQSLFAHKVEGGSFNYLEVKDRYIGSQ